MVPRPVTAGAGADEFAAEPPPYEGPPQAASRAAAASPSGTATHGRRVRRRGIVARAVDGFLVYIVISLSLGARSRSVAGQGDQPAVPGLRAAGCDDRPLRVRPAPR